MSFTDFPLDRPVATVMLLVCLTVLGAVAIAYLPLGFMPIVREPEIDVYVPFPGSHPLEGLRRIVRPLEEEIATIPDVDMIFGWSNSGQAGIEARFDWDVDVELKLMEVREAVERARPLLPRASVTSASRGTRTGPVPRSSGGASRPSAICPNPGSCSTDGSAVLWSASAAWRGSSSTASIRWRCGSIWTSPR